MSVLLEVETRHGRSVKLASLGMSALHYASAVGAVALTQESEVASFGLLVGGTPG